jgi:hypothetical protein
MEVLEVQVEEQEKVLLLQELEVQELLIKVLQVEIIIIQLMV